MIHSSLRPAGYQNWSDVPALTKDAEEVLAKKATLTFSASTTLKEKVKRVFNGTMFFIAGAKLLSFHSGIAAALSKMSFTVISSLSIAQIPAVMTIITFAPKIITTLAILLVVRKVLAVMIGSMLVYPAACRSEVINSKGPSGSLYSHLDHHRQVMFNHLNASNFECRRIALNKSGIDYDAFVFEHQTTKDNGKWVMIAGGNNGIVEENAGAHAKEDARKFKEMGFNILFINGPGVGRSSGYPTSYSIQAGQEAGLQFLEKAVQAKKILLYGLSLGGGAQGEAIKNHEFRTDIDYMVWADRTFDKFSNVATGVVARVSKPLSFLVKPLLFLLGIELDGIAGSKKLQQLGIRQIVTQSSWIRDDDGILPLNQEFNDLNNDGVISNNDSRYVGLKRAGIQDENLVRCYGSSSIQHSRDIHLHINIMSFVKTDIADFLAGNPLRAVVNEESKAN